MQSPEEIKKDKPDQIGRIWKGILKLLFATFLIIVVLVVVQSPDLREGFIEQLAGNSLDGMSLAKNVAYTQNESASKVGDLYIPNVESKDTIDSYPAVVVIHGGSWRQGSKEDPFEKGASIFLARHGFVAFSIDYPLVGSGGGFPEDIISVKEAVQYLGDNSEKYNIDKDKLFLLGYSSGAHLAMMAAYTKGRESFVESPDTTDESSIVAVASFAAPSNLEKEKKEIYSDYLKNYTSKSSVSSEKLASPINYASSAVPTILLHGTLDKNVPLKLSEDMAKSLSESQIENKIVRIIGGSHWIGPATRTATMKQVLEFFQKQIQKKQSP